MTEAVRHADGQTGTQTGDRQKDRRTNRQGDRQKDRQRDIRHIQTDIRTERQINRQMEGTEDYTGRHRVTVTRQTKVHKHRSARRQSADIQTVKYVVDKKLLKRLRCFRVSSLRRL